MSKSVDTEVVKDLDELDRRILNALQLDSSQTNQELATRVHASPATCLRRVRRLQEDGYITRQMALLDPARLGQDLIAIVEISLDIQTSEKMTEFEALVQHEPAVQQCYRVAPGPDFILQLLLSDMPAYHALAHRLFSQQQNIRNVRTFFCTHRAKFDPVIPL
ncbi:Lrp/AsnC family transcriptional regulator [Kerstersia gyiorum]|uniref:AsnC family transcriptional regulator n=1 Tax=Kerstersia gyiorum TaxID=206506 RepID=A0A171KPZ0_9BURK|nr:Lrp/AsnC family transcriptional regulator [Kerstersia gyiorum]MCO7642737.1 Lrp/AsnC family transcriptional regulator [Pseudomonas sp. S 311-6]KAB0544220.1 Lrp/AsnC family transcriptional regulator [Kerstersia gyiorum]KKO70957.1 AsnC family transcriptional regulator [Kerstersia gyiorum]MCP1631951.1 Lrp/AsnC family leucine-responsive transcriptional regulator [Kerstersia gyiorum]MCP1637765.1 Lrp/AsnC family leucine-responsive transcriptional regulator [Kerstersia gyiorum]